MKLDELVQTLGEPDYRRGDVAVYQGDCLEFMRRFPDNVVQATVTSPPYNIGKEYEERVEHERYLDWIEECTKAVHAVTVPNGALWLNLGYVEVKGEGRAVPLAYLLWNRTPFYLRQEIVWSYGAGTTTSRAFAPRNEKLLWFLKDPSDYIFNLDAVRDPDVKYPNQRKNGKLKVNPLGKNPGDVWYIPKVTSGAQRSSRERMPHPAQYPEALVERAILASTNPGDLVLDPFLGSGTTAAVAARLGRQFVGFELRPDYMNTLSRRLDAVFTALGQTSWAFVDDSELPSVGGTR